MRSLRELPPRLKPGASGLNGNCTEDLVVIEAPGKVAALKQAFEGMRYQARIVATQGHLLDNPSTLRPVGIDENWRERLRRPRDPARIAALCEAARDASRIVLATDADIEGDAIAYDAACLIAQDSETAHTWVRLRLRGLGPAHIREALAGAKPVSIEDLERAARPAAVRRVVDRVIGTGLSSSQASVGRVQSALLGAVDKTAPIVGEIQVVLKAADRGTPFCAAVPIDRTSLGMLSDLQMFTQQVARLGPTEVAQSSAAAPAEPWHFGDALLGAMKRLGTPLGVSAQMLQRLYEAGALSYPRTGAHALTDARIAELGTLAAAHRLTFDPRRLPHLDDDCGHAHEALCPIGPVDDIAVPLKLLQPEAGLRVLIARQLLQAGAPMLSQTPDLDHIPEPWRSALSRLGLSRLRSSPALPWRDPPAEPGYHPYPPEAVALSTLLRERLGHPSTWVDHASKFTSRGLVDTQSFTLTDKGRQWVELTPPELLDPTWSRRFEQGLDERPITESASNWIGELAQKTRERLHTVMSITDDLFDPAGIEYGYG